MFISAATSKWKKNKVYDPFFKSFDTEMKSLESVRNGSTNLQMPPLDRKKMEERYIDWRYT